MNKTYYKSKTSKSPLSGAVKAVDTLYLSGQLGIDPQTNQIVSACAGEQTQQAIENMKVILAEAGMELSHIVKTMVYISNREDLQQINAVYAAAFGDTLPARSCIIAEFPDPAVKVEIEGIAVG